MVDHAGGRVAVMAGIRTPFAKAGTAFRLHSALELAVHSVNGLLEMRGHDSLGSSIAVGHPFAATGARIVTTLASEMARRGARYELVSIYGTGATAAAMILEGD